jgi:hypothetical protein
MWAKRIVVVDIAHENLSWREKRVFLCLTASERLAISSSLFCKAKCRRRCRLVAERGKSSNLMNNSIMRNKGSLFLSGNSDGDARG